jgi:hypothetical protein
MKDAVDPMQRAPMHLSPRCSATSKRTGLQCKAPAVRGCRTCRMHGARGGGPKGRHNGRWRHGLYEEEVIAARKLVNRLARSIRRDPHGSRSPALIDNET